MELKLNDFYDTINRIHELNELTNDATTFAMMLYHEFEDIHDDLSVRLGSYESSFPTSFKFYVKTKHAREFALALARNQGMRFKKRTIVCGTDANPNGEMRYEWRREDGRLHLSLEGDLPNSCKLIYTEEEVPATPAIPAGIRRVAKVVCVDEETELEI